MHNRIEQPSKHVCCGRFLRFLCSPRNKSTSGEGEVQPSRALLRFEPNRLRHSVGRYLGPRSNQGLLTKSYAVAYAPRPLLGQRERRRTGDKHLLRGLAAHHRAGLIQRGGCFAAVTNLSYELDESLVSKSERKVTVCAQLGGLWEVHLTL